MPILYSDMFKIYIWTILHLSQSFAFQTLPSRFIPKRVLSSSTKLSAAHNLPVIPIIGPIINAKPLMIGGEMYLDPPTPLQWKTLQECVVVHRNELNKKSNNKGRSNDNMQTATIDAAPLIAIIDETTNYKSVKPPFSSLIRDGRYATLAAVVGIRSSIDNTEENFLDYMDVCSVDDDGISPTLSSVRLIGIGRAFLNKFFYRVPTELLCSEPNQAVRSMPGLEDNEFATVDDAINHGYSDGTPIVMAEFEPLVDDASVYSTSNPNKIGEKGQRGSYRKSPIHALSELNTISIRVSRLHDDRRKLVNGIKAAKARLNLYSENLEDMDGLGALFGYDTDSNEMLNEGERRMNVDDFLDAFKDNIMRIDPNELPQNLLDVSHKVNEPMYGMNYFGALSSIPALTKVAVEQLEPYYSAKYREREEYDLEVSSFVAFRCLDGFADAKDMAWALHCTSSIERLNRAYEILFDHIWILKCVAKKLVKELEDCGEECTDLW